MPDSNVILTAMFVSLTISAGLMEITGWFSRRGWIKTNKAGYILGIGLGFFAGCWVLGVQPRWRPREDLERLLIVVLPAVIGIELLTALLQAPGWLVWPIRLILLAGTAHVLLYETSYTTDLTGPGTSEWSMGRTWLIFGGMATMAGAVWALLSRLAHQVSSSSLSICLAITSAGTAVTVMLSGYATGGQIGFALAGALMGTTVLALFGRKRAPEICPPGVPFIGLFSLLLVGYFFGTLRLSYAVVLLCAPLLCWLPELSYVRRLPSWVGDLTRIALVGAIVFSIIIRAQAKFNEDSRSSRSSVRTSLSYAFDPQP